MSIRSQRVAEEIRKVISQRLIKGLREPLPSFVTISAVEVTPDLSIAKVYYSIFGDDTNREQTKRVLEAEKKAFRQEVGRNIRLRLVPELVWIEDRTPAQAARIHELLGKAAEKKTS